MKEFFKNLRRYPTSSALNIIGLAIAFASAYIILVQVNHDLNYNKCLLNADQTFRLENDRFATSGSTPFSAVLSTPFAATIGEDELVDSWGGFHYLRSPLELDMPIGDGKTEKVTILESWGPWQTPQALGFELVAGTFAELEKPNTVILNESLCRNYNLEVGQVVMNGQRSLTIGGIFKDFPKNSDFYRLNMFIRTDLDMTNWNDWNNNYFFRLKDASPTHQEAFLENCYQKFYETQKMRGAIPDTTSYEFVRTQFKLRLTPLSKIYFTDDVKHVKHTRQANRTTTLSLLAIAIVIIVVAFINFINFFMAMVPRRIRRVNTEKVFGCPTWRLRLGFVGEAMGLVTIALLIAGYLIFMIAPGISASQFVSVGVALGDNLGMVLFMVGLGLMLAIISSIYPAWYITSMPPAFVIKGSFGNTKQGRRLRYVLLGFQFVISTTLIICSLFIKLQHSYMMRYEMGFNKEHVLVTNIGYIGIPTDDHAKRNSLAYMLKENPIIQDVAYAQGDIVKVQRMGWGRDVIGKDHSFQFSVYPVSWNFLQFMGIEVYEGRDFEESDEYVETGTFIFNETAQRENGLTIDDRVYGHQGRAKIAGFCKDFHSRPLQYDIEPFAFYVFGPNPWQAAHPHIYLRTVAGADIKDVQKYVTECAMKLAPGINPDDVQVWFFDKELGEEYEKEQELTKLITIFSLLSIVISLLGVFGLVYFETQYRRREIALRRVHGAQIREILQMFVVQYAKIVLVAFAVAVPISILIMMRWLQTFAYHTPLHWWVFLIALAIVLAVTSAIVLARSWKAARENPVNALYKE